jgi:hypothetical protein
VPWWAEVLCSPLNLLHLIDDAIYSCIEKCIGSMSFTNTSLNTTFVISKSQLLLQSGKDSTEKGVPLLRHHRQVKLRILETEVRGGVIMAEPLHRIWRNCRNLTPENRVMKVQLLHIVSIITLFSLQCNSSLTSKNSSLLFHDMFRSQRTIVRFLVCENCRTVNCSI